MKAFVLETIASKALVFITSLFAVAWLATSNVNLQAQEKEFDNPEVVAKLRTILKDIYAAYYVDPRHIAEQTKQCGQIGKTVEESVSILAKMLESENREEILWAAAGLNVIGTPSLPHVPRLLELRSAGPLNGRFDCTSGIKDHLRSESEAPKLLLQYFKHEKRELIWWSYEALTGMKSNAKNLLPYFVQMMDDERVDPAVRNLASEIIGSIGAEATWAIPSLVGHLTREESKIDAVSQLAKIGPAVLEDTTNLLVKGNDLAKRRVLNLYARLAEKALPALPHVTPLIESKNKWVSFEAAWAYWQMTHKLDQIEAVVSQAIVDPERCERASQWVERMGEQASAFTTEIVKALKQPEFSERTHENLILSLAHTGPASMASTPVLEFFCQHESLKLKHAAAVSLFKVSGSEELPVKTLIGILKSDLPRLKQRYYSQSMIALGKIGPGAQDAVPVLEDFLNKPKTSWRHYSAKSLAQIGGSGETVLRKALNHEEVRVREKARWALDEYFDKKQDEEKK